MVINSIFLFLSDPGNVLILHFGWPEVNTADYVPLTRIILLRDPLPGPELLFLYPTINHLQALGV